MPLSAQAALRILKAAGFSEAGQKGSHLKLKHADVRRTILPMHRGDLKDGTRKAIEKQTRVKLA